MDQFLKSKQSRSPIRVPQTLGHPTQTASLDLASDFATRPRPTSNFASTWTPNSERVAPPPTWSFDLDQPTSARSRPQTSTSSLDLASDLATRPRPTFNFGSVSTPNKSRSALLSQACRPSPVHGLSSRVEPNNKNSLNQTRKPNSVVNVRPCRVEGLDGRSQTLCFAETLWFDWLCA